MVELCTKGGARRTEETIRLARLDGLYDPHPLAAGTSLCILGIPFARRDNRPTESRGNSSGPLGGAPGPPVVALVGGPRRGGLSLLPAGPGLRFHELGRPSQLHRKPVLSRSFAGALEVDVHHLSHGPLPAPELGHPGR